MLFEAPTVAGLAAEISQALADTTPNEELAEILDQVERLSDDEIAALLAENSEQLPPAPRERLLTHDLMREVNDARATEGSAKAAIQRFYDAVNSQLDTGVAGEYSFFLNYGYVADGRSERAVHQLPSKTLNRNCIQLVLEVIGNCDLEGRRVLDVGCGRGGTIVVLQRFFSPGETVGLDLSPVAIEFCRRTHLYPQVSFLCGDAERLPFPAGSFDAVVNIESSHSYPDIDAFYAEVSRVLKPDGVFLYSDTMPASGAASRLERLTGLGFRIELARDITSNVVRSCDELAGIHAQAFDAGTVSEVLGEFLAVPGSQNYDNLRSGRLVYGIWQLRKN